VKINAVRGMKDLLPPQDKIWSHLELTARKVFTAFGFNELRPPLLEHSGLFARAVGEGTDIVEKEMYTFNDRGGDSLTLRPEATAGVVRAYLENKLYASPGPHKFFTIGPMFRYERPQKGRLRQFHQLNCEILDDPGPHSDAELIIMIIQFMQKLGLHIISLLLNSLGCRVCRPAYRESLLDHLRPRRESLCEDCRRRLEVNPLRALDCKTAQCREITNDAPHLADALCPECQEHFRHVTRLLGLAGINFVLEPRLVRGLDYYQRTTFEIICGELGAQNAVAGGGRYDGLIAQLGGPDQPGLGFAAGLERLALLLPAGREEGPELMVAALGTEAYERLFPLVMAMREENRHIDMPAPGKSLKSLMRRADKLQTRWVAILGGSELAEGKIIIRDLRSSGQTMIALDQLPSYKILAMIE
jgi:histidyl-tRNA synthetase